MNEIYLIYISIIVLLLILSAFFSGSETALFSISKSELYNLALSSNKKDNLIALLMKEPQKILVTILIGNLIVNFALTTFTTDVLMKEFGEHGHFIAIGIVTPLIIIICEIIPKVLSIQASSSISRRTVRPLNLFHLLFTPLRSVFIFISNLIVNTFQLHVESSYAVSTKEIDIAVKINESHGYLAKEESEFIKNVLRFSKKTAENVMIPRNKAVAISYNASIEDAVEMFKSSGSMYAPVYKGDMDEIIGMIDTRDLLPYIHGIKKGKSIKRVVQDVTFYPESKELAELLNDFLDNKLQMAVVLDEYGGTSGIVTLSAIISEVMGDSFRLDDTPIKLEVREVSKKTVISADMQIHDFNDTFHDLIVSDESETVGGYVIELLGHIPQKGESVKSSKHIFIVRNVSKNRIVSLEIKKI
jgi:putative hemolysin